MGICKPATPSHSAAKAARPRTHAAGRSIPDRVSGLSASFTRSLDSASMGVNVEQQAKTYPTRGSSGELQCWMYVGTHRQAGRQAIHPRQRTYLTWVNVHQKMTTTPGRASAFVCRGDEPAGPASACPPFQVSLPLNPWSSGDRFWQPRTKTHCMRLSGPAPVDVCTVRSDI